MAAAYAGHAAQDHAAMISLFKRKDFNVTSFVGDVAKRGNDNIATT